MSVSDGDDRVFFERTGTFRTWPYILIMLSTGVAGFGALGLAIREGVRQGLKLDQFWGVVLVAVWTATMIAVALGLAYRVFLKPGSYARIDQSGVTVESKSWKWNDIERVFDKPSGAGMGLFFQTRGVFGPDRIIYVSPPLAPHEAEAILTALTDYLGETFPHVGVG